MRRSLHFLLFAVRDSWVGRPLHQNASYQPPSPTCLSCGSGQGLLLSIAIWSVEGHSSAPVYPSPSICFLTVSHPFALFIFPCLVPTPFQTQRPFSNVVPLSPVSPSLLPNLCWRLCCTHLLFRSSLDTCSVNVCLGGCVWDAVHVKKKKEIRTLSHVLLVKSCFSMPRKWGVWRTMTPAWLNEN